MKSKEVIIEQQKDFIQDIKNKTSEFINSVDKSEIEAILLSGSVSRGDFFPAKKENGEYNGMIDLIVMRKKGSNIKAEDIFGPDQDPPIPYHCVKVDNLWFAILFTDFIDTNKFSQYEEPRKFSVLESRILYDPNNSYKNELEKIKVGLTLKGKIHGRGITAEFRVMNIAAMADFANWRSTGDNATFDIRSFSVKLVPTKKNIPSLRPGMTVTFDLDRAK